jgi:NTE family protein
VWHESLITGREPSDIPLMTAPPSPRLPADLVLEGGGVKGIALVGAISVLEERGYSFRRVGGTSAGAIVGALVAAGMSAADLTSVMREVDYRRFRDGDLLDHLGGFGQAMSVLIDEGIYRGEYLRRWLGDLLADLGVRTFADLVVDDRGGSFPRDQAYRLVVMASDVSQGRLRRLPWDYRDRYGIDPFTVPVADAVRASMSIPFFYEPVKLKDRLSNETCWLVDGGMLSNFPVDVFDRTDGAPPRWPTFGMKLSNRAGALQGVPNHVDGAVSLARAMVATMTSFHDQLHLEEPGVVARTIFIDTLKVRSTDFDIDRATQQLLYDSGRRAATRFLDGSEQRRGWDFAEYVARYRSPAARPITPVPSRG